MTESLSEAARQRAREIAESRGHSNGVAWSELELRGLLADLPTRADGKSGVLDEAAFTASVDATLAESGRAGVTDAELEIHLAEAFGNKPPAWALEAAAAGVRRAPAPGDADFDLSESLAGHLPDLFPARQASR